MPGLFDGMRISISGIQAFRTMEEVVANNAANTATEGYSRQQARLATNGTIWDGQHFLGQGVQVTEIIRIRDELLDHQIRDTEASSSKYTFLSEWLNRIEATYNEPTGHGISQSLSEFWGSWQTLHSDPKSLAARSSVLAATENLASQVNSLHSRLEDLHYLIVAELEQTAASVSAMTKEIAALNNQIFEIEAGRNANANDLRDSRDIALDRLSKLVDISYNEDRNGMINVTIAGHPAVIGNKAESLIARPSLLDTSKLDLVWEYGEYFRNTQGGRLAGILEVRDDLIPGYQEELDTFASMLITEVNKIYSQGVALVGSTQMESSLGYEALGVKNSDDTLSLLKTGETRTIHLSLYDASGKVVRSHGVLISSTDSLQDISSKLNLIRGMNVSLVSDTSNDGRLNLQLDTTSGINNRGETSFAISNNTGAYDTGGVLARLGFSAAVKSTNLSAAAPVLTSRDLTELQTEWGEANVTDVRNHVIGASGRFTINLFETMTENTPSTDGHMLQQLTVTYGSTDTINTIMTKINALSADFGVAVTFNGGTNKLELTSTAQTDADGNVVLAAGLDYLRMGLSNTYGFPSAQNDTLPDGYTGTGDEVGLFYQLQMNMLFSGNSASSISLSSDVNPAERLNAGQFLADGDNRIALAILGLETSHVTSNGQYSISEHYSNLISSLGTDVLQNRQLANNEELLLQSYLSERDSIMGVDMQEELSYMIMYQRAFEANARMFSTFNQMAEELLRLK